MLSGAILIAAFLVGAGWLVAEEDIPATSPETSRLDPAAWGADHVGQPMPAYVTGDECLFCHRQIGTTWPDNRHQRTVRAVTEDDPAVEAMRNLAGGRGFVDATTHLMGGARVTRILKRSDEYGKFELLNVKFSRQQSKLVPHGPQGTSAPINLNTIHWDATIFADRCAGCHATGVDVTTRAFTSLSLDCFVCHGEVDLAHTKDTKLVLLSKMNQPAQQVISLCGQCHLRGGASKTSGLPYPHTFVAGDNLFRDYQVELTTAAIEKLPLIDQHIFENARNVVLRGDTTTCLSCHDVHGQNSERHQQLASAAVCASCHGPGLADGTLREAFRLSRQRPPRSAVCDY